MWWISMNVVTFEMNVVRSLIKFEKKEYFREWNTNAGADLTIFLVGNG